MLIAGPPLTTVTSGPIVAPKIAFAPGAARRDQRRVVGRRRARRQSRVRADHRRRTGRPQLPRDLVLANALHRNVGRVADDEHLLAAQRPAPEFRLGPLDVHLRGRAAGDQERDARSGQERTDEQAMLQDSCEDHRSHAPSWTGSRCGLR